MSGDPADQMAGGAGLQPVVLVEPVRHLGRGVLQRLVQRPGIADGDNIIGGLATRPGNIRFRTRDIMSISKEVSISVPTISPSPWQPLPSPR